MAMDLVALLITVPSVLVISLFPSRAEVLPVFRYSYFMELVPDRISGNFNCQVWATTKNVELILTDLS